MLKTDFCVVGFPKCGTTAVMKLLAASPSIHSPTGKTREFPFYIPGRNPGPLDYSPDAKNGHKCTGYAYSDAALDALMVDNPDVLVIFMVRASEAALMSWRDMHRSIAEKNAVRHPVTRTRQSRQFFSTCSVDEYFTGYAHRRLRYAKYISRFVERHPGANVLVVSQRRLSEDTRGVIAQIHKRMGARAPKAYLSSLPQGHQPRGERSKGSAGVSPETALGLERRDAQLARLLSRIDASRVLLAADGAV